MASRKLLLSGISGSIGVHFLAHIFTNTDWDVTGVASFRHKGWSDRIVEVMKDHPDWSPRLKMITHDLVGPFSEMTKKKLGNIDYIINLASLSDVEASIHDPVTFIQNNVWSTLNLLEYAREVKPEAFVQFSTDEVFGPTNGKSFYKEWDAHVPSNPYAASKSCQEQIATSYWRTYGVPVIITHTMNNFGEMQQGSKFPVMIQKAIESGEEITIHGEANGEIGSRSYIHSRNVADAVLFILKNTRPYLHQPLAIDKPDCYNIAGDKQLTNLELAETIARLMGKELKYKIIDSHKARPGHDPHYGLDDSKLRNLGWKSPVSFEESLRNTIKWQQEYEEWIR